MNMHWVQLGSDPIKESGDSNVDPDPIINILWLCVGQILN